MVQVLSCLSIHVYVAKHRAKKWDFHLAEYACGTFPRRVGSAYYLLWKQIPLVCVGMAVECFYEACFQVVVVVI